MKKILNLLLVILLPFSFSVCKKDSDNKTNKDETENLNKTNVKHVAWSRDAIIYEVNLRHHTNEGTFNAFTKDLARLKKLGVKIIWLMPIHPISIKKRKAFGDKEVVDIKDPEERKKYLGSPYAVADYKKVNPDFGTMADFKQLVEKAHELGMYVIIDWVANHTGWDNPWIEKNPEWFTQNEKGEIIDPIDPGTGESWGWTDVADLNFDNKEMRAAMIDALVF